MLISTVRRTCVCVLLRKLGVDPKPFLYQSISIIYIHVYVYIYIYIHPYLSTNLPVCICLCAGVVTSTRPWTRSCTRSATRTSRSLSRECCADPQASTETPRCPGHRGKLEKLITIFNFSTLSNYIWMFSVPHLVTFDLCVIKVDIVMILFFK